MWKKTLRCAAFLLIFVLLFLGISPVFVPKGNGPDSGIHEHEAKGFLAEPKNSLDVLFLGDSETFSAFIPLRIWENYGITSYLCSTPDQVMYQSRSYLERFFREQSPRVVILETNALYREYTLADVASHEAEEKLPFLRYHDRWKTLTGADFTEPVEHGHLMRDKGYTFRTRAKKANLDGYMAPSEELQPVPLLNQGYARQIRDFCRERDVMLVFISTPSPVNWSTYYHNGTAQLAQELEIPYIDMNLMPQEIPIDWETDSYDGGDHLNYFGACKTTDYIGSYLWETGLFADKRELPEYEPWHSFAEEFRQAVEESK